MSRRKVDKNDLIEHLEDAIGQLQKCVKDLKKSKERKVTIYLNTDNGGYSDDPMISESFGLSASVYDEDDGLTFSSEFEMFEVD